MDTKCLHGLKKRLHQFMKGNPSKAIKHRNMASGSESQWVTDFWKLGVNMPGFLLPYACPCSYPLPWYSWYLYRLIALLKIGWFLGTHVVNSVFKIHKYLHKISMILYIYIFKEHNQLFHIYPSKELENKHVMTTRSHCLIAD